MKTRHFPHIFRPAERRPSHHPLDAPGVSSAVLRFVQVALACILGAAVGVAFALAMMNH